MKKIALSMVLGALAACSAETTGRTGTGFGTSIGGTPQATTTSPQTVAVSRATSELEPKVASGPLPASLANVWPRYVERWQTGKPVPVYETTAALSQLDLATISDATKDAIDAAPNNNWLTGHRREVFGLGLVNGTIIRVRVNGVDYAQMTSGTFLPSDKNHIFDAIAYRSGCAWTGSGDARVTNNPYIGSLNVGMWYARLSC